MGRLKVPSYTFGRDRLTQLNADPRSGGHDPATVRSCARFAGAGDTSVRCPQLQTVSKNGVSASTSSRAPLQSMHPDSRYRVLEKARHTLRVR